MSRSLFAGALVALTMAAPVRGQLEVPDVAYPTVEEISAYVLDSMERRHIPGVSWAVIHRGVPVQVHAAGVADLENVTAASSSTIYEIGSVGKPMTASLIMLLDRDGKLSLDDPIEKYLDEIPSSWNGITIRNLLQHTSGIPNYSGDEAVTLFRTGYTRAEIIDRVRALPVEFAPWVDQNYSNTNYYLLGAIAEEATNQSISEALEERVFHRERFASLQVSDPERIIRHRAEGYDWVDGEYRNRDAISPSATSGAGFPLSNALDLALWAEAFRKGEIVPPEIRDQMWTEGRTASGRPYHYGLGWSIEPQFDRRIIGHRGATVAFSSGLFMVPDEELIVVVLANQYRGNAWPIAAGIADRFIGGLTLSSLTPGTDPDPVVTRGLRRLFDSLGEGRLDDSLLTDALVAALRGDYAGFREHLRVHLEGGVEELTFIRREETRERPSRRFGSSIAERRYYRVDTAQGTMYFNVHLTANGRVADIDTTRE